MVEFYRRRENLSHGHHDAIEGNLGEDDAENRMSQSQNESKRVGILSETDDVNLGTYQDLRCQSDGNCVKNGHEIIGNKTVIEVNFG